MADSKPVPNLRIRICNRAPVNAEGDFVLFWMIASRRMHWNFALERAVEWAQELRKPLVILEALRCEYPWASDRLHRFVLEGMADNAASCKKTGILYYPYVEPTPGRGKGLLAALAARACTVITDEFPCFFLPHMVAAASRLLPVRLEAVDSNGLLPLRACDRTFTSAHSFRRFFQSNILYHLSGFPLRDPLKSLKIPRTCKLPETIIRRWPMTSSSWLAGNNRSLARLPIDHGVKPVPTTGGSNAGEAAMKTFLRRRLGRYAEARNQPAELVTSGLSPYLHFGQISVHQVFTELMRQERWSIESISPRAMGQRNGWWGVSAPAEAFLDQLIIWRELGFNMCWFQKDYDHYDSLPGWARETLDAHAVDPRAYRYTLEEFQQAQTHDELWNAAQRQLLREGRIHNYLRMLWGKKILEWTPAPSAALAIMIHLNNRYALDGRDPNSYSGIFWCLGRYDRPWWPERPVFGTIRYMSSQNTARKINVQDYLRKYAATPSQEV
jgi:deoxyribodipyrimidine photo-lyase